jgi:hypothetical protein
MVIRLDENYNAMTSTALLGYVGETNARPVSVEGMEIDGADRYVLTIDYGDGVTYEVDITGGQWTPTADILRSAQTVSCQICAKKLSGDEYILVKKSRIFRLRIGAAIGDTAIPSPDVSMDALDRIDAIGRQAHADMQTAVTAAETATTAAENAEKSATDAEKSADTAEQAASRAETAKTAAETAAQTAQAVADSLPEDYTTAVGKIAENTAEIASVKLTDKELQRRVDALYDMGNGITHQFETDSDTAYAKTVPTGTKLMSVKSVGGKSVVWNQLAKSTDKQSVTNGITFTSTGGIITAIGQAIATAVFTLDPVIFTTGHKYLIAGCPSGGGADGSRKYMVDTGASIGSDYGTGVIGTAKESGTKYFSVYIFKEAGDINLTFKPQLYDLTAMFGSGNEPASVEEFEAMFPADYYPYGAGEIVSAEMTEVAVGDTAHQIPEAIRNLPGYGWSAGTARNYVDYENKRYVQCVGSVDLGTLTWMKTSSQSVGDYFYAPVSAIGFKRLGAFGITVHNILCSKYITVARNPNAFVDKTIVLDGDSIAVSQIQVKDTAYTDAASFKQAMQGVILYYELANPIVTDISSLIPDDFLRNIEVEAGGSVTFKNSNDNYHIPVPSEEEYVVKLSEVGGTT